MKNKALADQAIFPVTENRANPRQILWQSHLSQWRNYRKGPTPLSLLGKKARSALLQRHPLIEFNLKGARRCLLA
jgi:hypothetical protein